MPVLIVLSEDETNIVLKALEARAFDLGQRHLWHEDECLEAHLIDEVRMEVERALVTS